MGIITSLVAGGRCRSTSIDKDFSLIDLRIVRRREYRDTGRGCFPPAVNESAPEPGSSRSAPEPESQAVGACKWFSVDRSSESDVGVRSAAVETVRNGRDGTVPADGDRSRAVPSDGERSRDPPGDADDGEVLRRLTEGRWRIGGVGVGVGIGDSD